MKNKIRISGLIGLMTILVLGFNNCAPEEEGVSPFDRLGQADTGKSSTATSISPYTIEFINATSEIEGGNGQPTSIGVQIKGNGDPNIAAVVKYSVFDDSPDASDYYTDPGETASLTFSQPVRAGDIQRIRIPTSRINDGQSRVVIIRLEMEQTSFPNAPRLGDTSKIEHQLTITPPGMGPSTKPSVSFVTSSGNAVENQFPGDIDVTVRLESIPASFSGSVTVDVDLSASPLCGPLGNTTCANSSTSDYRDITFTKRTLTLTRTNSSQTVRVSLINDSRKENVEYISLELKNISSNAREGTYHEHHIRLVDDNDPGPLDNEDNLPQVANCQSLSQTLLTQSTVVMASDGSGEYSWTLRACDSAQATTHSRLFFTGSNSQIYYLPPSRTDCGGYTGMEVSETIYLKDSVGNTAFCTVTSILGDGSDPGDDEDL